MTTDLWMLIASAGLQWALLMATASAGILRNGIVWATGNRPPGAEPRAPGPALQRMKRASDNLLENLPLFAILVLVAHVTGRANDTTALGAQIFVGARVAHAVVYVAGIPWLRTLVWAVSIAGMALIASVLF